MQATQLAYPFLYRILRTRVAIADCWEWTGPVDIDGYGHVTVGPRNYRVHRFVWEHLVGPIASGLHLDHLCKNRRCVNPDHLEPVTPLENIQRSASVAVLNARKTHCSRGHAFTGDNLYIRPDGGGRQCRICRDARGEAWKARKRAATKA